MKITLYKTVKTIFPLDPSSIKYYDQNASRLSQEYHSADVSGIHAVLDKWLPAGGDVLEIGCGSGRDAAYMASLGCKVTATDASEGMVAYSSGYFQNLGISDGMSLHQAAFPLAPSHNLLSARFDAVVAIALLMHIPDSELFEFAIQVRTVLKFKGIFFCSFSSSRESSSDDSRLFVNREPSQVQLFFERIGFRLLYSVSNDDGMGREIIWHTLVFESEGSLGIRPVDQIEAIINRDRKSATYKLALLRALCEIAQTEYHYADWHPGNKVSIPLGLISEKWLYYYWPLIESETLLPQLNGGETGKKIAFRGQLKALVNEFRTIGGLNAFDAAYRSGKLSPNQQKLFLEALKSISDAIVKGPVYYAGGSLDGNKKVFEHAGSRSIRSIKSRNNVADSLGRVYFDARIWHEMSLIGHWIGEAIILRWAELVHGFSSRSIPVSEIISHLLISPEVGRDVNTAKTLYSQLDSLHCVWSNKDLTAKKFDVDHIIPFTLWHNNDLWNLVPTHPKVNNQKRDKIVSRETLLRSRDQIIYCWQKQNKSNSYRFQNEVGRTLLGKSIPSDNWENNSFQALSETIEIISLQRGVERWESALSKKI